MKNFKSASYRKKISEGMKKYFRENMSKRYELSKKLKKIWKNKEFREAQFKIRGVKLLKISQGGYIKVHDPLHPRANKNGRVMEHIKVITEKMGRQLKPGEVVHHIDGCRRNNSVENLIVLTHKAHMQHHALTRDFSNTSRENNGNAKITSADVKEIRKLRKSGMFLSDIGNKFSITKTQVCNIVNGKAWRSVKS